MIKKSRVFWIFFMVLAIFLLSVCSKKKSTKPEPPKYKWTILGYFDGNNEQDADAATNGSYVIQDVQEMEQIGSTENFQIIVMLGSIKTGGNCNYYLIEKHLDEPPDSISSKVLESLGPKDMSDPETLKKFIEYGVENYPADHYMLIINDHGSGWKGVCSDEQNGDGEMMTLPGLDSALSGYEFDIILFNAPSMSMVEVAYQLKDKANYLVASQFNVPMQNVLGSSKWLQDLADNPNITASSLADNIAEAIYTTAAVEKIVEVSISAIDLSRVDALTSKIADFGSLLVTHTGAHWKEVVEAREIFSYFQRYRFDLKKFCQNIQAIPDLDSTIKNAAQAVQNDIEVAIVKTLSWPDLGCGGLCIHLPYKSENFDSTDYVQLAFAVSDWHIFLSRFIQGYVQIKLGSLRILSEPVKGAWIFLDGDSTGLVTDTTIHGIPEGRRMVKLVKAGWHMPGYEPWEVPVVAGTTVEVIIMLFPGSPSKESISDISEF